MGELERSRRSSNAKLTAPLLCRQRQASCGNFPARAVPLKADSYAFMAVHRTALRCDRSLQPCASAVCAVVPHVCQVPSPALGCESCLSILLSGLEGQGVWGSFVILSASKAAFDGCWFVMCYKAKSSGLPGADHNFIPKVGACLICS